MTVLAALRELFRPPLTMWRIIDVPDSAVTVRPWCIIPDDRVITYAGIPLPNPLPRPLGPRIRLGTEARYTDSATIEFAHLVFYDAAGNTVAAAAMARGSGDIPESVHRGHRWTVRVPS